MRSTLALVTQSIATFPPLFLMPFYLVDARGLSLGTAGAIISALPICMVLSAPLAGVLSDRFGSAAVATAGMLLVGGSLLALAQFGPDTAYVQVAASLAGVGAGAAMGNAANAAALMSAVPASRRGMASGTLGTARYIGQSVGVALTSSVITLTVGGAEGPSSLPGFGLAFLTLTLSASISAGLSAVRGEQPRFSSGQEAGKGRPADG
jgi:DHA2 family multidrug resistance protein-like MFS transporter